jgi:hypothetical protein
MKMERRNNKFEIRHHTMGMLNWDLLDLYERPIRPLATRM